MDELFQTRLDEFGSAYEDYEDRDIANLLTATGDWLQLLLMDTEAVDTAMRVLVNQLCDHNPSDNEMSWRETLDREGGQWTPQSVQFMVALNAFAFWGLVTDDNYFDLAPEGADLENVIEAHLKYARKLCDSIPAGWGNAEDLTNTTLAAEARFALDMERDVTVEQLAAIARISPKSIRNMLTPKAGGNSLSTNHAGKISSGEALRWLQTRDDFKASIWRQAGPQSRSYINYGIKDLGEVFFVPVAKGGSWFDPISCKTTNGYVIGPKGAEETIADYRVALERLARMPTPYWRRPNNLGNRGIVAGVSWQRKVAWDLGLERGKDA